MTEMQLTVTGVCNSRCKHHVTYDRHPVRRSGKPLILNSIPGRSIDFGTNVGSSVFYTLPGEHLADGGRDKAIGT
jgi:hypothetical protein